MDKDVKTVADHFAKQDIVREMHDRTTIGLKPWEHYVVETYFTKPHAPLLDIGCGPGREAFALFERGFRVTGIDISEVEIDIARDEAKRSGRDVVFETADGLDLTYDDDQFDYIVMWAQAFGNVYGHDHQLHLLEECYRVLKPGGYFCFSGHGMDYIKHHYAHYTDGKKFYAYSNTDCYWELFTLDELRTLCEDAGFYVIQCCASLELSSDDQDHVLVCVVQK